MNERFRSEPVRVVIAKPGLDGHERGALVMSQALRDAGMEVVYTGIRAALDTIVNTVLQEDPDVLGLSILSGAHNRLVPQVMDALAEAGIDEILVVVGGVIPAGDRGRLREHGVAAVYTQDQPMEEIVEDIHRLVRERRGVS